MGVHTERKEVEKTFGLALLRKISFYHVHSQKIMHSSQG